MVSLNLADYDSVYNQGEIGSTMFNQRLRRYREYREMTQKQLGQHLNYSQQTIHKWESGETSPDPQSVLRLARALRIPVTLLLGEHGIAEDAADYQSPLTFIEALVNSDDFFRLFHLRDDLSVADLSNLIQQMTRMTEVLVSPYQQK
jgi:transcriptional regulator with XRE-family HTH domain